VSYFVGILVMLVIYGIIIKKVDSGRCFRYEFIIKTLRIYGLYIVCFVAMLIAPVLSPPFNYLALLIILLTPFLMFLSLKYTIQRLYDLNLDGWYILLKLIPMFSIVVTIYLYLKKGDNGINDYDKAINYKEYFKNKHFINIYDKMFVVDNEEYQYERYLTQYTIKISKYGKENFFTEYLYKNYQIKEDSLYKTIEITKDEFEKTIEVLGLVTIYDSFYIKINGYKIFIREEDFKYTIILDKNVNEISKETVDKFNFPGSFYEDKDYIYYHKIDKKHLREIIS